MIINNLNTVDSDIQLLKYSLSDIDTRNWYINKLGSIPSLVNPKLSLRERALQFFKLRNDFKLQARDLMANRELAESLPSPQTLKNLVSESYKDNVVGDKMWQNVIDSSMRTNKNVDKKAWCKK